MKELTRSIFSIRYYLFLLNFMGEVQLKRLIKTNNEKKGQKIDIIV